MALNDRSYKIWPQIRILSSMKHWDLGMGCYCFYCIILAIKYMLILTQNCAHVWICPRQLFVIVCCCLWFLLRMVVWCCFQTVESITPTLNEISNNVLYHEHKSTFGNDTAQTISCSPESSMMKENVAPVWFKVWLRWQIFLRGALWWELNCLNLRKKIKGSDESCH